ncbi:LPD38 domain-containing protein [uncultured Duncaniella sp.]|nr:LPD38 domain-containing protein [uncultured Duncaniella sp.]
MDEVNSVLATDREYRSLEAARREAEKRVQTIQHENDRQNGKDVGFWRGFGEVVSDSRTWDFGLGDMQDALTKASVAGKEPNARSDAENAVLEQTAEAQEAETAYGQNDSFWNRAGVMTGEMLPFMLDFALMGGSSSGTSAVTRTIDAALLKTLRSATPKVARNKATQWTVKVLGAMPEDLLYRAPLMTNTVQGMKTTADIIDRKLGDVVVREDGTYNFSNNKTWGGAIWQGEANAIIENYSEMFGTHLEGVLSLNTLGKIADTFGAKRLTGILAKASNSDLAGIAGTMQKHLNQLGVSDYFGEVGEEYYGQLWRTMLNLDDAYKQNPDGTRTNLFLDGQFHGDIWGGMALSMGLMGAGKYTLSAAAYGSMKHRVNKTDTRAAEIFTPEVWEGWRDRIDGTTNADIGSMAESIINDNTLTAEQRDAAMSYMEASLNLRGFNLGSVARQRGGEQTAEEAAANESYMDGYTATTPQEMNDAKRMLDLQRQRLASSLSEDVVPEFDADPIGALSRTHDSELRRIAADYVNAKQVYDGMIQRVRDDIDGRIAQSDAMIDSRVNRETGMIQPATLKLDDRQVYIVNGTVSMYEDGTGVDADNSSESVIIRDAESGKIEFVAPSQFRNIGEDIDAETEKEAARNQITQEIAQAAANNIDGAMSFAPGETYSVLDIDGNPEDITILGNSADEEGMPLDGSVDIQYPDGTIQSVLTSNLQQWVDSANEHRVEQFIAEQNAGRESAVTGSGFEKELTEDLESEGLGVTLQENQANTPNSENGNGSQQDNDEPAYSSGDDGGSMAGDSAGGVASNRDRGYIRVYEEGLAAERDGDPGRSERARRTEESERLVAVARQQGQYIDRKDFDSLGERRRKPSGESVVYINEEQGKVYKIKNPVAKSPMKGNVQPEDVIYEHLVHNKYFPETAYGFEGISDEFGDVRVVLSQDFVKSPRQATKDEVESALAEKGLYPEGNYRYGNDEISVTDVTGDNALVGADGKVYFIDPIIDFKKPVREILPEEDTSDISDVSGIGSDSEVSESALSRIPVDERTGVPVFEQVDADTAWDGVVEFVENEDDAREYADSMVEQLTKDVATAEKNVGKVKAAGDIAKFKAEKAAARQALADAQARLEHWTRIAGVRESRITEAQRQEAEAERLRQIKAEQEARQAERQARDEERASRPGEYAKAMAAWEEPSSLEERILHDLAGGGIKLRWSDRGKSRGLGAHLFGGKNTERRWEGEYGNYKWLVDDNTGLLPEEYAERLAQDYYNDYENDSDHYTEVFGAVLDVLGSYASSKDMWARVQELHQGNLDAEAMAEDFERIEMEARGITEEDLQRDRMYREQYGMTEDEWDEFYMTNGYEIDMSDDEFETLNTNLSELKADEQYEEQRLQQAASDASEQGGASGIGEDGNDVVREAGLHESGPVETSGPEGGHQESSGDVSLRNDEGGSGITGDSLEARIAEAEATVNTTPSDKQKEAGNYKKGHVQVGTFDVTIENPKGSTRKGVDPDGTPWETTMTHTYGYIRGTKGVDGDHIDVYISSEVDGWNGRKAFVVDQYNPDGTFDEHKVMLGFNDRDEAFGAYLSNYESGWEKGRRLDITEVNMEDFEKWIESSKRKTKPFAEYKSVKTEENATAYEGKDPLHDEIMQWLGMKGFEATEASRSAVMRYFKIGYNRATQILNAIAQENAEAHQETQEPTPIASDGYTIVSKPYTNKQGKTLDTHLVTFDRELTKEDKKRLRDLAKSRKGWPDKETGGYMLRSRDDAEAFAKEASEGWASEAENAPVSLSDIEAAIKPTAQEITTPETENSEQKPNTPVQETAQSEQENKPTEAAQKPEKKPSKWVDEEDAEEFARLRDIIRNGLGQLNVGFPPELLYAGAKMSYLMMKHGVRKFAEYATAMIEELGDAIRPHLKSLYNFTRSTEEVISSEWANELTPFDEVMKFDTANFDKPHVDALATAENVVAEEDSQKHIEDTTETIKDNIRHNPDGSTTKTITEGGIEMDVTEGDFIPGVLPAIDEQKPEKKPTKPKPATTGQLDLFGEEEEQIVNDVIEQTTPPEAKPEAELSGDSAEYQDRARQERDLVDDIVVEIVKRADMKAGGVDKGPLSMRDIRVMLENYDLLTDISATDLQELVERAMTILTRTAAKAWQADPRKGYERVVAYYNMQPSLNARDSERLIKQQYSTPTPFGYVMGQFVNAKNDVKSVLEPSAGNGALTIMFDPSIVHVNDIDQRRLENLRTLGYDTVTAQNGLLPFEGEKVDGVLTNPPFGSVTEKIYDGIFRISSLEGQMAINALDSMKDGGRAAIIIGGNTSYRTNGSMNPKDAAFFGYLYSHYNVVDVININGKALYARNGTGYDVRMILIDGRKTSEFKRVFPPVKSKARAEQVTTFDELYKRVQDDIQQVFQVGNESADVQPEAGSTADGAKGTPVRSGEHRPDKGTGEQPNTASNGSGSASGPHSGQPTSGNGGSRSVGVDNGNGGNAGSTDNVPRPKPTETGSAGSDGTNNDGGRSGGNGHNTASSRPDRSGERLAVKPDLTTEKVPYPNQSDNGFTLLSVVPAAQAEVLQRSLGEIGDVDQFLVDKLGYSSKEELYNYLAAEQIDSVALAIHQMNKGNAFIIGDMTGVGKGRQGAALIRYGVRQGRCPIYFTQKPTLFTDNYRDLADIGSSELRPFIIASNPKDANIVDANGKVVHKLPSKKEQERVFDYIMHNSKLPPEYDYVLTTYDQIKNGTADYTQDEDGTWSSEARKLPKKNKGYTTADYNGQTRRNALARLAMGTAPGQGNIAILDESHTVGGDSGCGRYMQMLTSGAYGVTFLSATFAKRADNMPIYAQRTAIAEAGVKANELIEAIAKGGVTLQEIMSKQLVESGQMIRRERSFEGVSIDWLSVEEATDRKQRQQFNEVANIFNSIRNFQNDFIKPIIDGMNDAAAEQGATVGQTQGTKDLGVRNTPFASKMYNLVNQLLFALKVDAVADRVIENLRNGYKPVISFTNTMEGFLASAPKGMAMDEVPNFALTLMRALDGVMRFTENDADQNSEGGQITFSQLSPEGQAAYNAVKEKIMNLSADLPISPMDAIRMKIEEAGYSVAEITGRTTQLNRTEDGQYIVEGRKDRDKKAAMRDFNSGKLDVLMINKSGSTGISLHASSKFEDQRQRVMVFAQFQSDINDEVQMRGRIDRSGQVVRGRYEYIMSTIPAEQRIQMMFKAKLKSLDANTTSSQKSKFNEMEIVDYLNKYGDEVVWEYMKEHPELSDRLGDPLNMLQDKSGDGSVRTSETEDTSKKVDCAGKISRYLAFLSVEEQDEIFKEITEAYKVKIQLLDDAGENDLEITTMPLRAETKSKQIWHKGENPGSGNAFADNTYVEEVEVDVLKKPMKRTEIEDMTRKLMGDKLTTATEYDQQRYGMKEGELNWGRYADKMVDEVNHFFNTKVEDAIETMKEAGAKRVAKAREKSVKDAIKARAKGENTFSDQEIEALADVVAKEAQDGEDAKQYRRREEINAVRDRIKHLLSRLRAGHIYVVPQDLKQASADMFTQTFGTFVGFKFNKSYTLGSSTAIFATLDGRRKVELALNDKAIDTIIRSTDTVLRYSPKEINSISMDNWDSKVPTQTRQTRHIITGNLLQALVDTEKGERTKGNLISFSTLNGETRQGILMSENFKPTDLRNSVPLRSRLKQIQDGHTVVSEDGDVQIQRIDFDWKHRGEYELRVPKSKQRGGIYTMHPKLMKLVDDHNFITKGSNMVGYVLPENLAKVVDILSGAPFNLTVLEKSKLQEEEEMLRYRLYEDLHGVNKRFNESLDQFVMGKLDERFRFELGMPSEYLLSAGFPNLPISMRQSLLKKKSALERHKFAPSNLKNLVKAIQKPLAIFEYTKSNMRNLIIDLTDGNKHFLVGVTLNYKSGDIEINSVSGLFPKDNSEWLKWIQNGKAIRIDGKEKIQAIIDSQRTTNTVESERIGLNLDDVANLVKKFENPRLPIPENLQRDGDGSYSDSELSYENDPWSKAFGESLRTKKKQKQFAERMRRYMAARANKLANTLGVEIEIIEDASGLEDRKRKAKGWYDTSTGKITIVLDNHKNVEDIEATMLHEVVAHHGLRELFGEKFDAFLDAVYENAENSIKEQIDLLATKNGWSRRVATEEYLAALAERTDFENTMASWWSKLKNLFMDFLRNCGFQTNIAISDNELRYVLWMSWKNLQHPGAFKSFLGVAEKVAKEYELGVGAYAETDGNTSDVAEPGERFRDGDFTPHDRKIVASIYENMVAQGSYQFREATQDSMLGLKKLYEAILTEGDKSKRKNFRIEEVAGYENAYLYENRMSSANNGEQQQYFTAYMKPLLESIHNLCGSKEIDRRILADYMMAKHGLERNEYMRNEAAAAGEETERDFAGLCGLTGKDNWQAAEAEAQKIVEDYENDHDTTELWDNVKRATTATLDKIYLTGLISEDTYNKVLGMYDYYIPLRGWEETTSDEVYGYLTSKDGPLMGNVFKTAKGRESKADDPIATIAMMADDAIRQGNRNVMKQRFLNFVHGNPSDLVSVTELWLQHNDVTDEWEPVFADLEPNMTNAEVESEIAKFETKMEGLAAAEPTKYKRSRDAKSIPYKVVRGHMNEHQVLVKRNGYTYVMTINGNPRAAQALNGLTNPNVEVGGIIGNMLKAGEYINRNLSAFYTTRNPDFVMSNFLRDMLYSNAMTWVKENPRYALRFHRNFGKINPMRLRSLLAKWESNNLSDGIYIEKMFKEFMLNGGETGYTSVKDIEGHKRTIAAELKKQGSVGRKAWVALGKQLDLLNRSAENCARFAAFLTSREMGRPLDRSIYDAKEISVNFNKKGSGGKFVNATGQKTLGKIGSYLGGGGRIAYVFWNAGVQGLTNFGRAGKRNPGKAMAGAATLFALGSVIPLLAQLMGGGDGDDDDKNAYYNLPEYVRRSNICFKAGDQWITIPLPIEYRAIYGMGELSTGVISGNERYSNAELARQMAAQVSQIMPLDMLEGGGGISPFIPSAAKPFMEAYVMNKGWTGLPVYKDTPFNKDDPEWTKAYQSADQHLVGFTKWLNEISGGDDFKKGVIDINPAKLEYLLNGTFGGMMTFPMKVKKTGETAFGDREFEWRNMPLVNRVIKSGDERTASRKLQNEYFKYKQEAEETDRLRKKYENAEDKGILAYAEKIDFLYNSDEYLRYEIYKKFESEINAIHEEIKLETDPEGKKELQAELYATVRELVDELHEVGK